LVGKPDRKEGRKKERKKERKKVIGKYRFRRKDNIKMVLQGAEQEVFS